MVKKQPFDIYQAIALTLGLNLWATLAIVPLFISSPKALTLSKIHSFFTLLLAIFPLFFLLFGVFKRHLLSYAPLFLIAHLPFFIQNPSLVAIDLSLLSFILVATAFMTYLIVGPAFLLRSNHQKTQKLTQIGQRKLPPKQHVASNTILSIFLLFFPFVFIYSLAIDPINTHEIFSHFPDRHAASTLFFLILIAILWLLQLFILSRSFLRLYRVQRLPKTSAPRIRFYLSVGVALIAMTLLFFYIRQYPLH